MADSEPRFAGGGVLITHSIIRVVLIGEEQLVEETEDGVLSGYRWEKQPDVDVTEYVRAINISLGKNLEPQA